MHSVNKQIEIVLPAKLWARFYDIHKYMFPWFPLFSNSPHAKYYIRNELFFKQFWGEMISWCLIWYLSTWKPFSKSILGFSNRYVGTHITHAFKPLLWHILMYIQRSWNSFHLWNMITNKSQTFRKSPKYNKIKSSYFVLLWTWY